MTGMEDADSEPRTDCTKCSGAGWVLRPTEGGTRRAWCGPCEGTGNAAGLPRDQKTQYTQQELDDNAAWDVSVGASSERYMAEKEAAATR